MTRGTRVARARAASEARTAAPSSRWHQILPGRPPCQSRGPPQDSRRPDNCLASRRPARIGCVSRGSLGGNSCPRRSITVPLVCMYVSSSTLTRLCSISSLGPSSAARVSLSTVICTDCPHHARRRKVRFQNRSQQWCKTVTEGVEWGGGGDLGCVALPPIPVQLNNNQVAERGVATSPAQCF